MPALQSLARSSAVKIMLHPDVHANLRLISDRLGQTPSTVASMAVSEYVAQKMATLGLHDKAISAMVEHLGPMLQKMAQDEMAASYVGEQQLEAVVKQLEHANPAERARSQAEHSRLHLEALRRSHIPNKK